MAFIDNFGKLDWALEFNRTGKFPLDRSSMFSSYADALAYAKQDGSDQRQIGGTSYIGQIVSVFGPGVDGTTNEIAAYIITAVGSGATLMKFAQSTASGNVEEEIQQLGTRISALEGKMTTVEGKLILASATNDGFLSKELFAKLSDIAAGAQVNVIEGIKVNGAAVAPVEKIVDITVPTGALAAKDKVAEADLATALATKINGKLDANKVGAAGGVASLDADGKVPSSQLPSYVDDVIEVANKAALPETGEAGKIYVTLNDNKTYRWGGTEYVEISASIALGETAGTAYEGSKGKANADAIAALQAKDGEQDTAIEAAQSAADAAQSDLNKFKTTVSDTYATKTGVTTEIGEAVSGLETTIDGKLAKKADTTTVTAIDGRLKTAEGAITDLKADVATKQTEQQVNDLIAAATIQATQINGKVASAGTADTATKVGNALTIGDVVFDGSEAKTVEVEDIAGLGFLTEIPKATDTALGGIMTGYKETGDNHAVKVDDTGKAYVTVAVPEVPAYTAGDGIAVTADGKNFVVSIANGGVTNAMLAGGITKAKIASVSTDVLENGANELILNGGTSLN